MCAGVILVLAMLLAFTPESGPNMMSELTQTGILGGKALMRTTRFPEIEIENAVWSLGTRT